MSNRLYRFWRYVLWDSVIEPRSHSSVGGGNKKHELQINICEIMSLFWSLYRDYANTSLGNTTGRFRGRTWGPRHKWSENNLQCEHMCRNARREKKERIIKQMKQVQKKWWVRVMIIWDSLYLVLQFLTKVKISELRE